MSQRSLRVDLAAEALPDDRVPEVWVPLPWTSRKDMTKQDDELAEHAHDIEGEEHEPESFDPSMDPEFTANAERGGESRSAPTRSSPRLTCPFAEQGPTMPTRGSYAGRYPVGAVVHYTAGRFARGDENALRTMRYGASKKCSYYCISTTGTIFEPGPLDRWGSHAGRSHYPGLGNWVSAKLVGIEICNAGLVEKRGSSYVPWWNEDARPNGTFISAEDVRVVEASENITQAGAYHAYTEAQEAALERLLRWLHGNNPQHFRIEFVLGHDEVAVNRAGQLGRKQDPGGALSMSMPRLRERLRAPPETNLVG